MNTKFSLLTLLFLFTHLVFAQRGDISGSIIDDESNEPVPFATVVILDDSSETVKGGISSDDGTFEIENLKLGTYSVQISFIGYQTINLDNILLTKNTPDVNVGVVNLKPQLEALNEVTVKAVKKTASTGIDRKTYSTNDFETAKGGNAADVLNRLPSVSVDPSGNVSVRGTSDFMVYLNGKPTQMDANTLLNQIAANSINKVDVITVPTARFDAQGKGGIINISTKTKGVEGLSISANGLIGGAPWANKTDKYSGYGMNDDRYGGGLNLVYNTKKVSLYGGFNYNKKNVNGKRSGDARVLVKEPEGEYFHMVAAGERPEWYEYYSANAGIDFDLGERDALALSYFYGNRTAGRAAYYVYNNFFADADKSNKDDASETWIYNPNIDNRYGKYHTLNADYSIDFNDTSNLKIAATYETSDLSRALVNENYSYDPDTDEAGSVVEQEYSLSDSTPLKGFRFAIDYSKDINETDVLSFGAQTNYANIAGDFKFNNTLVTKDLDNSIDLTRTVYAAYVDYTGKTGKLDYILGLRTEYGDQSMDVSNTDYLTLFDNAGQPNYKDRKLDVFPSAHLSYPISENDKLILAASRRVNRPSVTNLAPFLYRRHFEVYVLGDPNLEAEYLNNAELTYDTKIGNSHTLSLTGFYRGTDNAVFRVNTTTTSIENSDVHDILQENVLIRSYTNAGNSTSLGAELNANIVTGSFGKIFLGGSLYHFKIKGDVFGYAVNTSSTNWTLKGNLNLNISDPLKFSFDYNIKSNTVTSQGANARFAMANAAINYKPKSLEGWDFSLRGLDIFSSNLEGLDTNAFNSSNEQIFYQETEYTRNGPIVELGVSYTLNMNGKKKKEKEFEGNKHFK
ncbi:outer membrane beta-barrel protein [Tamlana sp. 2201CG12-4]|uniref:outer membrane beta-barrel protein n=1 Tax=Tamlana sp. 2201CG12-4 TaxID=3112582 RepID=UPI002DBB906E|nr:outer membrane beta-barrel protein [Tamlana sp. 2201CG12-4]MEC3906690.1 outer membrane beta-barrel protein [Tamlana sp. 2201CG12-4]